MIKGQKQTLTVSGTKLKVRWSSSNPSVASVSAQGVLRRKREVGDTVVSATVGGKKFAETVTVEDTGAFRHFADDREESEKEDLR